MSEILEVLVASEQMHYLQESVALVFVQVPLRPSTASEGKAISKGPGSLSLRRQDAQRPNVGSCKGKAPVIDGTNAESRHF